MLRTPRPLWILAAVLLPPGLWTSSADASTGKTSTPSPVYTGPAIPDAPQQKRPWAPPKSKVSAPYVSAITTLAKAGEEERKEEKSPYLGMASEWAWNLFDRGICAHARADDKLALHSFRLLTASAASIRTEAKKQGYKPNEREQGFLALRQLC